MEDNSQTGNEDQNRTLSTLAGEPLEKTESSSPFSQPHEPRNLLAAFGLLVGLGFFGVHKIYLGNKAQGWTRFVLALLSFPLSFILIGFVIMAVLGVWAIVDAFMLVFGSKKDAEGQPLAATNRDTLVTNILFWVMVASVALNILATILLITFGILGTLQNNLRDNIDNQTNQNTQTDIRYDYDLSSDSF